MPPTKTLEAPKRGRPLEATRTSPVLTHEQKKVVCKMIGEFFATDEIIERMKEQHHVEIPKTWVYQYRISDRWRPIIARFRQTFLETVADVPIFHKRVRIQRLENLWIKSVEDDSEAESLKDKKMLREEKLSILRQALDEAERIKNDSITTNILSIQVNSATDEELIRLKDRLIQRVQTYGGRLHATSGIGQQNRLPPEQGFQEAELVEDENVGEPEDGKDPSPQGTPDKLEG